MGRQSLGANIQPAADTPTFPVREPQSRTLANEVFEKLRADILSSSLPPGMKLRFDDLREAYGVGLSPLREALSRLAENRLVVATGQRGFRVPSVSVGDILDIAMVRKQVEGLALRLSIKNGDDAWEARVVAARYKVELLEKAGKNIAENVWESRHREFHQTLISACNSECLLHLYGLLSDQFDRYRRLSAQSRLPNAPRSLIHQQILDAALSRKANLAVKLLGDHIDEAATLIVNGLSDPKAKQPPKPGKVSSRSKR
ncbi:MAG: FCD domain-containing protein [Xanthobacteraceae bacterium]|nr:FCD domain-containing protein [Xanthobacteraceae bacterium]